MATTKAEIAAALGTSTDTLDTMVGLVASLEEAGLDQAAIGAWAATMGLATVNARLEGWQSAVSSADGTIGTARQAAVEAVAAARARTDLARARVNAGADPDAEQAAVLGAAQTAGAAVGALAQALGAQAAAIGAALAG